MFLRFLVGVIGLASMGVSSLSLGYGMVGDDGVLNASGAAMPPTWNGYTTPLNGVGSIGGTKNLQVNVSVYPAGGDVGRQGAVFLGMRKRATYQNLDDIPYEGSDSSYFYYKVSQGAFVEWSGSEQQIEPYMVFDGGVPSVISFDVGWGQDWCQKIGYEFFVGMGVMTPTQSKMVQMVKEGKVGRYDANTGEIVEFTGQSGYPAPVRSSGEAPLLSGNYASSRNGIDMTNQGRQNALSNARTTLSQPVSRSKADWKSMALTFVQDDGIRGKKYHAVYKVVKDESCRKLDD